MCGISGEVRFDRSEPSLEFVQTANQIQWPRGPDSGGLYQQDNVVFGHRRLMIMDLSDASRQPLYEAGLGLLVSFNGAIYNYRELRQELEAKGYQFYSDGDAEVVLKAYHAWRNDCFSRFNGMFAIAVWDRAAGELVLARDRLGIKPLYYEQQGDRVRFASSLIPLAKAPDSQAAISPESLNFYLNFHSVVPAPRTLFEGIRRVQPGTLQIWNAQGQAREERYWNLVMGPQDGDQGRSESEWMDLLHESLLDAVKARNVAAVDVGVLLSGGVDSSLLVGLLAEFKTTPIETFSIGFESAGGEKGDEFQYSDLIARHYRTSHHRMRISERELLDALPKAIEAMSEPMVSHDCVAFYLLAQEVRKHCRVVQSGQGADEVFGGYHWYPPLQGSADPVASYRQAFFDRSYEEYQQTVGTNWLAGDMAGDFLKDEFGRAEAEDPVDKALRLDTTVMLVDDPVKRVDNMTMAAGLEARVPFLDHRLVELAGRMPASLKVREGGKWILKETARRVIPHEVIDRPKGYFPVPGLKYLRGDSLDYVASALGSDRARERGLFNPDYVSHLLKDPEAHITPLRGSKLWQLALLEIWLQTHDF